ncbi:hypothetical protein [Mesorhizobium neociceri]|uniref:Uncharacterized protein n=1 Tax=Mesorhizobium neociceri TaxID=1307853 RepID=A0A838B3L9_9HYPH|nr:hypothetical protein [Mesorhizobium neociceri]MBA1140683.1 hypothetical protein [Mesorhizobium neociceri]
MPVSPHPRFLPGVPADHVLDRLNKAGGNEAGSGKLDSPQSSAALAINAFGWFVERPGLLPPFPQLEAGWPPELVEVEYCARFPWSGGRHPWLDAFVETGACIIGVESKRFEPFRDTKTVSLSAAYDRPVWGNGMNPYERMRDLLRSGEVSFVHLDAAQLVKHAFGLVTEATRRGKPAILLYLFAEPERLAGRVIDDAATRRHRTEIDLFAKLVAGAAVRFVACSYREWLGTWEASDLQVRGHGNAIAAAFRP